MGVVVMAMILLAALRIICTVVFFVFGAGFILMMVGWGVIMTLTVAAYLFMRMLITGDRDV